MRTASADRQARLRGYMKAAHAAVRDIQGVALGLEGRRLSAAASKDVALPHAAAAAATSDTETQQPSSRAGSRPGTVNASTGQVLRPIAPSSGRPPLGSASPRRAVHDRPHDAHPFGPAAAQDPTFAPELESGDAAPETVEPQKRFRLCLHRPTARFQESLQLAHARAHSSGGTSATGREILKTGAHAADNGGGFIMEAKSSLDVLSHLTTPIHFVAATSSNGATTSTHREASTTMQPLSDMRSPYGAWRMPQPSSAAARGVSPLRTHAFGCSGLELRRQQEQQRQAQKQINDAILVGLNPDCIDDGALAAAVEQASAAVVAEMAHQSSALRAPPPSKSGPPAQRPVKPPVGRNGKPVPPVPSLSPAALANGPGPSTLGTPAAVDGTTTSNSRRMMHILGEATRVLSLHGLLGASPNSTIGHAAPARLDSSTMARLRPTQRLRHVREQQLERQRARHQRHCDRVRKERARRAAAGQHAPSQSDEEDVSSAASDFSFLGENFVAVDSEAGKILAAGGEMSFAHHGRGSSLATSLRGTRHASSPRLATSPRALSARRAPSATSSHFTPAAAATAPAVGAPIGGNLPADPAGLADARIAYTAALAGALDPLRPTSVSARRATALAAEAAARDESARLRAQTSRDAQRDATVARRNGSVTTATMLIEKRRRLKRGDRHHLDTDPREAERALRAAAALVGMTHEDVVFGAAGECSDLVVKPSSSAANGQRRPVQNQKSGPNASPLVRCPTGTSPALPAMDINELSFGATEMSFAVGPGSYVPGAVVEASTAAAATEASSSPAASVRSQDDATATAEADIPVPRALIPIGAAARKATLAPAPEAEDTALADLPAAVRGSDLFGAEGGGADDGADVLIFDNDVPPAAGGELVSFGQFEGIGRAASSTDQMASRPLPVDSLLSANQGGTEPQPGTAFSSDILAAFGDVVDDTVTIRISATKTSREAPIGAPGSAAFDVETMPPRRGLLPLDASGTADDHHEVKEEEPQERRHAVRASDQSSVAADNATLLQLQSDAAGAAVTANTSDGEVVTGQTADGVPIATDQVDKKEPIPTAATPVFSPLSSAAAENTHEASGGLQTTPRRERKSGDPPGGVDAGATPPSLRRRNTTQRKSMSKSARKSFAINGGGIDALPLEGLTTAPRPPSPRTLRRQAKLERRNQLWIQAMRSLDGSGGGAAAPAPAGTTTTVGTLHPAGGSTVAYEKPLDRDVAGFVVVGAGRTARCVSAARGRVEELLLDSVNDARRLALAILDAPIAVAARNRDAATAEIDRVIAAPPPASAASRPVTGPRRALGPSRQLSPSPLSRPSTRGGWMPVPPASAGVATFDAVQPTLLSVDLLNEAIKLVTLEKGSLQKAVPPGSATQGTRNPIANGSGAPFLPKPDGDRGLGREDLRNAADAAGRQIAAACYALTPAQHLAAVAAVAAARASEDQAAEEQRTAMMDSDDGQNSLLTSGLNGSNDPAYAAAASRPGSARTSAAGASPTLREVAECFIALSSALGTPFVPAPVAAALLMFRRTVAAHDAAAATSTANSTSSRNISGGARSPISPTSVTPLTTSRPATALLNAAVAQLPGRFAHLPSLSAAAISQGSGASPPSVATATAAPPAAVPLQDLLVALADATSRARHELDGHLQEHQHEARLLALAAQNGVFDRLNCQKSPRVSAKPSGSSSVAAEGAAGGAASSSDAALAERKRRTAERLFDLSFGLTRYPPAERAIRRRDLLTVAPYRRGLDRSLPFPLQRARDRLAHPALYSSRRNDAFSRVARGEGDSSYSDEDDLRGDRHYGGASIMDAASALRSLMKRRSRSQSTVAAGGAAATSDPNDETSKGAEVVTVRGISATAAFSHPIVASSLARASAHLPQQAPNQAPRTDRAVGGAKEAQEAANLRRSRPRHEHHDLEPSAAHPSVYWAAALSVAEAAAGAASSTNRSVPATARPPPRPRTTAEARTYRHLLRPSEIPPEVEALAEKLDAEIRAEWLGPAEGSMAASASMSPSPPAGSPRRDRGAPAHRQDLVYHSSASNRSLRAELEAERRLAQEQRNKQRESAAAQAHPLSRRGVSPSAASSPLLGGALSNTDAPSNAASAIVPDVAGGPVGALGGGDDLVIFQVPANNTSSAGTFGSPEISVAAFGGMDGSGLYGSASPSPTVPRRPSVTPSAAAAATTRKGKLAASQRAYEARMSQRQAAAREAEMLDKEANAIAVAKVHHMLTMCLRQQP